MKSFQFIVISLLSAVPTAAPGTSPNALESLCNPKTMTSMADLLRCSPTALPTALPTEQEPKMSTGLRLDRAPAPIPAPQAQAHSIHLPPHSPDAHKMQFLRALELPTEDHNFLLYNWVPPVSGQLGYLTEGQRFGAIRSGNRPADCGHGHCGVDIARTIGTNVFTVGRGVVTRIGRNRYSRAGLWVELAHPEGVNTRYLHLHSIHPHLHVGDELAAGSVLGQVGNSGTASRGAHLHFELFENNENLGRSYFDPTDMLRSL